MAKIKNVVAYSPSESDFKHMRYCHGKGLIFLNLDAIQERPNVYHLSRTDHSTTPISLHYFLIDFKKPPMPANRQLFTEKEAYEKMFSIYKEFYMRGNNITEQVIAEVAKKDIELKKEPVEKKEKKPKAVKKDMINFPFKQMDLMEMIVICEEENNE